MKDYSRAVVLESYDQGPEVRELPIAAPTGRTLLVKVEAATVCGTDVHISEGTFSQLARLPLIMGHEGTGKVVELGNRKILDAQGNKISEGDLLVWSHNWCGRCYGCAIAKQPTLCENTMGYGWGPFEGILNGTFSEYAHVVEDSRFLKVPEGIHPALASSATCALRTVMHAFSRMNALRFSDTVVVLGAGPVGLYAAAAALKGGAYQTVLIGAPSTRLEATSNWDLSSRIDIDVTSPDERVEKVMEMTNGKGADVVIECAGPPSAFTEGLSMLRKGGQMMVVGQAHGQKVPVDTTALKVRQTTIHTSLSADISHYYDALKFLQSFGDSLQLEKIVTSSQYALSDVSEALDAMKTGKEMKPVITPKEQE
ncbi:MAG: zinc-binding dehydrogenase [Acidimicrobiales bacterium]|nr:zinc-binding dehydrogenase [Acidimicrobiales bacterium]